LHKFGNKHLAFLCGKVKGSLCLPGVSGPGIASLADDSDQVKYKMIADKPFINQLAVGQILFEPNSLIRNSGAATHETKPK